jgi:four helix bundle protein
LAAGTYDRFEGVIAWQKARELTKAIYAVTASNSMGRDPDLCRQLRRAAVSTMSCIAEGHERGGRGEYSQLLSVAKGSCGEIRSQRYVAYDVGALDGETFQNLSAQAEEVSRVIAGLRRSVEQQRRPPGSSE